MSITDNKPPAQKPSSSRGESAGIRVMPRRPILLGVTIAIIALVVGGVLWIIREENSGSSKVPGPTAPLTLPDNLVGYAAAPRQTNFADQKTWQDEAKKAAPGATVTGNSYGSVQLRRQIRVVAGRADLTGKLEFTWAADTGKTIESDQGEAHCTQNLKLVERSAAAVRPTMMFCSRITPKLSAYAVIIDFDHHPTAAEATAALDTTWKAALTGK
jgi:hypothetical protein